MTLPHSPAAIPAQKSAAESFKEQILHAFAARSIFYSAETIRKIGRIEMMNYNRYRSCGTGRSGCGSGGCSGSFTEYIPVTVNYEIILGNGFVGGDGIGGGNGISPANAADSFYAPASESSRYTPGPCDCL